MEQLTTEMIMVMAMICVAIFLFIVEWIRVDVVAILMVQWETGRRVRSSHG